MELIDYLSSPHYAATARGLAFICLLGAAATTIFVFSRYGRGREGDAATFGSAPWPLLIGTLRDSFLLTLLYVTDSLLYKAADIRGTALTDNSWAVLLPIFVSFCGLVVQALIGLVAVLRVLALSRWLRAYGG